jgi:hypothetical protein
MRLKAFIVEAGVAVHAHAPAIHRVDHLANGVAVERLPEIDAGHFRAKSGEDGFNGQGHDLLL